MGSRATLLLVLALTGFLLLGATKGRLLDVSLRNQLVQNGESPFSLLGSPTRSHPTMTTKWYTKLGRKFEFGSLLLGGSTKADVEKDRMVHEEPGLPLIGQPVAERDRTECMGVPSILLPYYIAFFLDGIAVGLVMPLLPFVVLGLGANAFDLSVVVSLTYLAQSIGCIFMGKFSDLQGRKIAMSMCLTASSLTYICLSRAQTLTGVLGARLVAASLGGLVPIMQSTVADVADVEDRPKYLGRITAALGLGFVAGPTISALLPQYSASSKILLAAFLPLAGLLIMAFKAKETKQASNIPTKTLPRQHFRNVVKDPSVSPLTPNVMILVLNGFAIMYAFATETIYAIFMKDAFGYGDRALSTIFAVSGLLIGLFQVLFIKPLIQSIGKHATLALGNVVLSMGMLGVGLVRHQSIHFTLFAVHIVGYSVADTALASLITKYSSPSTQGRDLAYNQSAQAFGRVLSPLVAGILYEWSKASTFLPVGALPFLAGALLPALALTAPVALYLQSIATSKRRTVSSDGTALLPALMGTKCWQESDEDEV